MRYGFYDTGGNCIDYVDDMTEDEAVWNAEMTATGRGGVIRVYEENPDLSRDDALVAVITSVGGGHLLTQRRPFIQ